MFILFVKILRGRRDKNVLCAHGVHTHIHHTHRRPPHAYTLYQTHAHARARAGTRTRTRTQARARAQARAQAHAHAHAHARTHTHTHVSFSFVLFIIFQSCNYKWVNLVVALMFLLSFAERMWGEVFTRYDVLRPSEGSSTTLVVLLLTLVVFLVSAPSLARCLISECSFSRSLSS